MRFSTTSPGSSSTLPAKGLVRLLGVAVGIIAANLYYAQPLTALISKSLGIELASAGLVVTLIQVGYGFGVLLLVPLGDLLENRKLILTLLCVGITALLGLSFATNPLPYFVAALAMGLGVSAVQIIVPYAAHMTPERHRGQVVGNLMSGLMLGIMLSRPIASLLTDLISWHAVFMLSAVIMSFLALALYRYLPPRQPKPQNLGYQSLISSLLPLFIRIPILRRRAFYQACLFGAFCVFWTSTPLLLAGPEFHLSQTAIAFFALAGVTGAVVAPLAGLCADRGWTRVGTAIAMLSVAASFAASRIFAPGSMAALTTLVISAILMDAGVTANLVMGQRAIFSLHAKYRSRLNGLYIAVIFIGGAIGSFAGAWGYSRGGWAEASWLGILMPLAGLAYFATEWITGFQKRRA